MDSRMNLTRITDPTEAAVKHYADSLALLLWVRDRRIEVDTVLDVGSGAGFPAVPLAVIPQARMSPTMSWANVWFPLTVTGTMLDVVVPSPSCPWLLRPQQKVSPTVVTPQA